VSSNVLRRLLLGKETIRVHLMVRGRVGETWLDVDEQVRVPPGTTLGAFIEHVGKRGIPLAEAIAKSPHLAHTLMWNGERCPVDESSGRALADGDQIYLLSPLAGG
jgi:molybdopterin converting factor small subunit